MVEPSLLIRHHPNQTYTTFFNQKSGFLLRLENKGGKDPFWCECGPELIDISITNWCDKGCDFCYRESNTSGHHMNISDYRIIMSQAQNMGVLQVALGGGNPNQHPDFIEILRLTREDFNIVPSYTTNGRGLTESILAASKKYCGAVAVSIYHPYEEAFKAINQLLARNVRTNIHFLLTSKTISTAIKWLRTPPTILNQINAIIFLNYKPIGRKSDTELLIKNSPNVSTFFHLAQKKYPF